MDTPSRPRTLKRSAIPLDPDVASHIKAKLQDYSKAISALENYKDLCERRILELAPGHPIPVTEDCVGNKGMSRTGSRRGEEEMGNGGGKFQSQQMVVRDEIERLKSEIRQLEFEKSETESSLRSEVLHSEEQRALIEALKQAIESKMSDLCLTNISVKDYCSAAATHTQKHDSYITIAKLQGALISQEEKIHQLEGKLTDSRPDLDSLKKELSQTEDALQHAISEMNRLEEEKSSLLDYIEEQKKRETEFQDMIDRIEPEMLLIKSSHDEAAAKNDDFALQIQLKDRTIQKLETEAKELTAELTALEADITAAGCKLRTMSANSATLSETLQETQGELDAVHAANSELIKELTNTQESLAKANQALEDTQCEKEALADALSAEKRDRNSLEASLQSAESQLKSALSDVDSLHAEVQASSHLRDDLQQKLSKLTQSHEELLSEIHTMTLASTNSNRTVGLLQDEIRALKGELSQSVRESEEIQCEKGKLVDKLEQLVQENQVLIGQLATVRQSEHTSKMESQQYRLECEEIRSAVLALVSVMEMTSDESTGDFSIRDSGEVIETIGQIERKIEKNRGEMEQERTELRSEITKLMELLERREAELTHSHQIIDELRTKSERYSAMEKAMSELEAENAHYRDLEPEQTMKMAQIECRISCLLRENEDLQTFAALVFKSSSFDDSGLVLERMIRCVSSLQQYYKDQYETEYQMLLNPTFSIDTRSYEQHISASRRDLMLLGEDLKAVFVMERRKMRELESRGEGKRGLDGTYRSNEPKTLVDRLNLPKVRSEVMKIRTIDSA